MSTHDPEARQPRTPKGILRWMPVPGQLELGFSVDRAAPTTVSRPRRVPEEGPVTEPLDLGAAGIPVPLEPKPRGPKCAAFTATYEIVDEAGRVIRTGVITEGQA